MQNQSKMAEILPLTLTSGCFPLTSADHPLTSADLSADLPPLTGGFSGPAWGRPNTPWGALPIRLEKPMSQISKSLRFEILTRDGWLR